MPSTAEPLAIDGGPPAVTLGPFEWPLPDESVREALAAVYRDGDWGRYHGGRCARLRTHLAEMHGAEHVQLTSSGTIAVELALRAVGVGAGDEVILAGYDFPGNFRAIEAVGAHPVLVDVGSDDWTIDAFALEAALGAEDTSRVRAVVVSHLHGAMADMGRLREVADSHGWALVEDACQTPGATAAGRFAGTWGDVGVLSFGGSKLLTAGRGGALMTSDASVAQRAKVFAERGNDAFPLSELQAAVLLPQLDRLPERNGQRGKAVVKLLAATSGIGGLSNPAAPRNSDTPAHYKVAWRARTERLRSTQETLIAALHAEGAPIDAGFRGFAKRSPRRSRRLMPLPHAESAAASTLLLHHPALLAQSEAIEQIAAALEKVLGWYSVSG